MLFRSAGRLPETAVTPVDCARPALSLEHDRDRVVDAVVGVYHHRGHRCSSAGRLGLRRYSHIGSPAALRRFHRCSNRQPLGADVDRRDGGVVLSLLPPSSPVAMFVGDRVRGPAPSADQAGEGDDGGGTRGHRWSTGAYGPPWSLFDYCVFFGAVQVAADPAGLPPGEMSLSWSGSIPTWNGRRRPCAASGQREHAATGSAAAVQTRT